MKKSMIGWGLLAVVLIAGGVFAYLLLFAGGSGEPTTDLTTPELTVTTTTTPPGASTSDGASGSTVPPNSGGTAFVIDQSQSTASFTVDEVLRGEPKTVVGQTDQVAGQMLVDLDDLSTTQISDIVINARTFETDSGQRDRTIRGPVILNSASDEFELITFSPTSIDGLSGQTGEAGEEFVFTVTGDLTIKGVTQSVEFEVVARIVDENIIEGTATAVVERSDFGIGIPNVPQVSGVDEEVTLTLEFVALAS